ncbi:MAG TPA: VOC family protein [Devosia sp.]|nr:VOC family protein [Devosia sp.]
MADAYLEHLNITVSDPDATARILCDLFQWKIRWQGDAVHGGKTIHVGARSSYLALYAKRGGHALADVSYDTIGGLNHIGVVVDDLDAVEQKVRSAGFTPTSHADYEPGRRFYFKDCDGIEFEVVSYGRHDV